MDGMGEYQNLLARAMNEYNSRVSNAKEEYATKLASVDAVRDNIEKATDTIGGIMITEPLTEGAKKLLTSAGREEIRSGLNKIADKVASKLKPYTQQPTEVDAGTGGTPEASAEEEAQQALGGQERGMAEEAGGTPMEDLGLRLEDLPFPEAGLPGGLPPNRAYAQASQEAGHSSGDVGAGEGGNAVSDDVAQTAQDAVVDDAATAATEGASDAVGAGVGDALEAVSGALDLDPFTALFGLLLGGVGAIVGGIEGANSIKNPSLPKVQAIANTSVQMGVGGS